MNLISLSSVSLKFGARTLLKDASLSVLEGDRLALVGPNGCGKTTLMKLMTGAIEADSGLVERKVGLKSAYLPQEVPQGLSGNIYSFVARGLGPEGEILARCAEIDAAHKRGEKTDEHEHDTLLHEMESRSLWPLDIKVKETLEKLELNASLDASGLSAGLKRRVLLCRELVSDPDVLLLDEPTNHLDIPSVIWLENFLKSCGKTCVFVSHDRSFLNALATRVVEVDGGSLIAFDCGFDKFTERRDALAEARERNERAFDKKLAKEEAWLRRGVKARRTRNEGRVRELMKLRKLRAERVQKRGTLSLEFRDVQAGGQKVFEIENLGFAYGGNKLIDGFSATVYNGDKIGIIGPNGCGKTTLIKLMIGSLKPLEGEVRRGTRLSIAYFDQMRNSLKPEQSPFDFIGEESDYVFVGGAKKSVVGYLQEFLFRPEQILGRISSLSGGEKNRLMLAKLFTSDANTLILDEPTNDLDMETMEVLESALINFNGTVLLVSHDRTFLNNVCTCVFGFEGNGKIRELVGGYDEWEKLMEQKAQDIQTAKRKAQAPKPDKIKRDKFTNKERMELESLPEKMENIEREQKEISAKMQDTSFIREHSDSLQELNLRYEQLQKQYDELFDRWAYLEDRKATLENKS